MRCWLVNAFIFFFGFISGAIASPDQCERRSLTPVKNMANVLRDHAAWVASKDSVSPKGKRADLSYADLETATLKDADLRGAILRGAKLQNVSVVGTLRLDQADLSCVLAEGASLAKANLFQANLVDASLSGAKLQGARLIGARLNGAELAGAD
ncbi:pentapeptide repeat-containing protein, partial [Mesorhizobium sp. BR1-1-7]|uniref:pentapeptide repeat-containing protein n=1 Tax=Mesorhizobium sp. BR1-1-7 TaxID=2876647 RepID=UPI001CC9B459